jgi:hypothetical protein
MPSVEGLEFFWCTSEEGLEELREEVRQGFQEESSLFTRT